MISVQFVKAEVIYYVQFISRDDVPALGASQLVAHQIWNAVGLPADQRTSVLALPPPPPPPPPQAGSPHVWTVNILCIVRTNPHKGRMIANYDELKAALGQLARDYPLKLAQRGVTDQSVDIALAEHLPNETLPLTMAAYAHADVIIGPHGAGAQFMRLGANPRMLTDFAFASHRVCVPVCGETRSPHDRGASHARTINHC